MTRQTIIMLCATLAFILLTGLFGSLGLVAMSISCGVSAAVMGIAMMCVEWS